MTSQQQATTVMSQQQPSTSGRGEPVELVHYNSSTGKFEVGPAALSVLKALRGPVSVVAVCGRARQVSQEVVDTTGGGAPRTAWYNVLCMWLHFG